MIAISILANGPLSSLIASSKVRGRCALGRDSFEASLASISIRSSVKGPCDIMLLPAAFVASAISVTVGGGDSSETC